MAKKRICIITGTRAEFGLLYWLIKGIKEDVALDLQLIATGMHLSPEFGLTYKEIENAGFQIDYKVDMLLSGDTPSSISKSTGLGIIGFADAFESLKPDSIIVLGDRFELLAAGAAALFANIPIVHIHGGETTIGAFDEAIRHSITKMAVLHFVATDNYKKRVIQLGENPERVFNVGGIGIENIRRLELLSKDSLEKRINFSFGPKNLLITYHPVTKESKTSRNAFSDLLLCFEGLKDTKLIFTKANSDTDGRIINQMIDEFVEKNPNNSIAFTSMGQLKYLSTMQFVDAVVGNSSSGILEAPSFGIGTINIGDRQKGRIMSDSIISCNADKKSIMDAFVRLYSQDFKELLKKSSNPYDGGLASAKIIETLKEIDCSKYLKKEFFDL